jgi:hypothetical protein
VPGRFDAYQDNQVVQMDVGSGHRMMNPCLPCEDPYLPVAAYSAPLVAYKNLPVAAGGGNPPAAAAAAPAVLLYSRTVSTDRIECRVTTLVKCGQIQTFSAVAYKLRNKVKTS